MRRIPEADRAGSRRTIPIRELISRGFPAPAGAGRRSRLLLRAGLVAWLGLLLSWRVGAETLLVWPGSPSPTAPYTGWATAARTIQDAVDAAQAGDTVLVTNGVYATGGRAVDGTITNRVAVTKPLTLRSVNGPAVTVIEGYQVPGATNGDEAIRCAYLTNGTVLSGFTLTRGATRPLLDLFSEQDSGGGVWCPSASALITNCTLTGNSARDGGGALSAALNNCILYYNTADTGSNYSGGMLNYSCTTPLPASGAGNIMTEPQLASASHISVSSPCRGAGSAAYATGLDIDGEAWLDPPSIGCDEYWSGAVTGALTVAMGATWTNVTVAFAVDLTGWIDGRVSASVWDFGDGTVLSNRPCASHAWGEAGDYPVGLRAYNESHPEGVSAMVTIRVEAHPVHYVSANSVNPTPPYRSRTTAARTIQDAVDAAVPGGEVVVTNGVYASGGRAIVGTMTNRVAVDRLVTVQSVNGPAVTVIEGFTRCLERRMGTGPSGACI